MTRGCGHSLAGHECIYATSVHGGLHECACGEQWEYEDLQPLRAHA